MTTRTAKYSLQRATDLAVGTTIGGAQHAVVTLALALMLVVLWTLTHHYQGFTRDAHIYAFQAVARLHPALSTDLYLQNSSQDRFTIFSPIYAACISAWGLNTAAAVLLALFTAWFLAAAWFLARTLTDRDTAWLAVAMLIITVGRYGAYEVFSFSEDYLTARSLGEALVVTALACRFCGWRWAALLIAIAAMFVHPLMVLPGLLLLLSCYVTVRQSVIGAAAGIGSALTLSIAAHFVTLPTHFLQLIDPAWLEVVRERSQFLFLPMWRLHDWDLNARPFLCASFTALAIDEPRIRKFCFGAILVGASGLAVAWIASLSGPLALLLQGQAWRWVWITSFVSVLLLPATVIRIWRDRRCGPLCAMLLVAAWTFSQIDGSLAAAGAFFLWALRDRFNDRVALLLRLAAVGLGLLIIAWVISNCWTYASPTFDFSNEPMWVQRIRNMLGLQMPAVTGLCLLFRHPSLSDAVAARATAMALAALALFMVPYAIIRPASYQWTEKSSEFADWQKMIPNEATVFVANGSDSPLFAWFTLGRPNYLSVDQSAGVVFSRTTAMEVRRRADVLRPWMAPDWRLLTKNQQRQNRKKGVKPAAIRPMTATILVGICRDPALGFLVAAKRRFRSAPQRATEIGRAGTCTIAGACASWRVSHERLVHGSLRLCGRLGRCAARRYGDPIRFGALFCMVVPRRGDGVIRRRGRGRLLAVGARRLQASPLAQSALSSLRPSRRSAAPVSC